MIYLILSAEVEIIDKGRGEFKYSPLLKIGYTKDINSRFDSYLLHNPGCKLLGTREGDTELESYFHSYYSQYKYPGRDREWFYYNQEIVDNFQSLKVGDKFLEKEEYIEGLREYIKSNISTPQELKEKYLEYLLGEIENIECEVEFDRDFHKQFTISLWEKWYEKEIEYVDSFNFSDLLKDYPERINLRENPWKNSATTFYYRVTADYRKMNWEDFEEIIKKKQKSTEELIGIYNNTKDNSARFTLASTYEYVAKSANYKDSYVAVNKIINDITGDVILKPVHNELVFVNELRAYKIQQIDYADRFTVFTSVHNQLSPDDLVNQRVSRFMKTYESKITKFDKYKLLCESNLSKEELDIILAQIPDTDEVKSHYTSLGPQRLRALGYNITKIRESLGIVMFSPELLLDSVYSDFKEGDKISLSNIKSRLSILYDSINYKATPKATDIVRWFDIKEVSLFELKESGSRRRIKAYELVKSKEHELREELKFAE